MKKIILNVTIIILFLLGIAVMLYPTISSRYNQKMQDKLIRSYDYIAAGLSEEDKAAELAACQEYNKRLLGKVVRTNSLDEEDKKLSEEYPSRLNLNGNGVMGHIEIPKINVNLVIYHGTTAEVLDKGVGHKEDTSLPVGGLATHAALTAHTAYAKATLFNGLIDLVEGDVFYITVLDETMAYQVDQIKVVLPTETSDLIIERDRDYVTLITCTPYGVNKDRLLVRGTRIPYEEPGIKNTETEDNFKCCWLLIIFIIIAIILVILLIILILVIKRRKKREKE